MTDEEIAILSQTSAELCPECGWRFLVPSLGCMGCERARLEEEVARLRRLLPPQTERGAWPGEGSWAVFAEKVVAERDALRERAEKAEANYAFMVERAANQHLDGYRELGARAAAAENEADRLRARLREVAQVLIAEVGADGPMDAEDAARKAVERMVNLRTLADEKAHEAGLCARRMEQAQRSRDTERAAVVAWLREQRQYGTEDLLGHGFANVCGILADTIESGKHRRKEE